MKTLLKKFSKNNEMITRKIKKLYFLVSQKFNPLAHATSLAHKKPYFLLQRQPSDKIADSGFSLQLRVAESKPSERRVSGDVTCKQRRRRLRVRWLGDAEEEQTHCVFCDLCVFSFINSNTIIY